MANHYPLIGRKVPGSCNDQFGTADPFAHVECPKCRARLEAKVAADTATAAEYCVGRQERRFFLASAANIQRILDVPAEGLSAQFLARVA
jgi:hypothetical protein